MPQCPGHPAGKVRRAPELRGPLHAASRTDFEHHLQAVWGLRNVLCVGVGSPDSHIYRRHRTIPDPGLFVHCTETMSTTRESPPASHPGPETTQKTGSALSSGAASHGSGPLERVGISENSLLTHAVSQAHPLPVVLPGLVFPADSNGSFSLGSTDLATGTALDPLLRAVPQQTSSAVRSAAARRQRLGHA